MTEGKTMKDGRMIEGVLMGVGGRVHREIPTVMMVPLWCSQGMRPTTGNITRSPPP